VPAKALDRASAAECDCGGAGDQEDYRKASRCGDVEAVAARGDPDAIVNGSRIWRVCTCWVDPRRYEVVRARREICRDGDRFC